MARKRNRTRRGAAWRSGPSFVSIDRLLDGRGRGTDNLSAEQTPLWLPCSVPDDDGRGRADADGGAEGRTDDGGNAHDAKGRERCLQKVRCDGAARPFY